MGIIQRIFGKEDNTEIIDLKSKVIELEGAIKKSSLSNSLAGVIGSNYYTLEINKDNYYKKNYAVYRGVNLLSENIASLPMKLFRNETELPIDHVFPNGFSMANPHPQMSLNELLYSTCIYLFFRGEFIQHIIIDDGIFRLQPINPKKIERNKNNTWKFDGKLIIPNEELIYSPLFNPNTDRGLSPIEVVKEEIENDLAAGNYNTKFFENFAQLGGVLTDTDGKITRDQMEALVAQFNRTHQGKERAYKTLGLPWGVDYKESTQTMREMEFLESRKDIRDRILTVLGIHKALVGVTDQVNRAVSEEAGRQMWAQTLKPAAKRIQEEYNRQLFNRYFPGYHIQFDFFDIRELQESMESKLEQAKKLREIGYSTNEINQHLNLGMEDISDPIGDTRFIPNYLVPFDDMFIIEEPSKKSITKEDSIDKIVDIMDKTTTIDKRNNNYINRYNKVQRNVEKKFHGKVGSYFSKQLGKVLAIVNGKKSSIDINTLLSDIHNLITEEKQVLMAATKPIYEAGSVSAAELALSTINSADRAIVSNAVVESMTNKITGISDTTYKIIRREVKTSVAAGETIDELSKRITGVYRFNKSRSRTIAKTESANLVNRTTRAIYKSKGVKKKIWGATMDSKTRDSHAGNDSLGEVDFNHVYANGMSYPGDPAGSAGELINCRCTLIPGGF